MSDNELKQRYGHIVCPECGEKLREHLTLDDCHSLKYTAIHDRYTNTINTPLPKNMGED